MAAFTFSARRFRVALLTSSMLLALTLVPAGPALAAPGAPTSCMGHEASDISPAGSNEEFPDGMVGLREEIRSLFPGVPQGKVYSVIARLHEGSHEACDAALQ